MYLLFNLYFSAFFLSKKGISVDMYFSASHNLCPGVLRKGKLKGISEGFFRMNLGCFLLRCISLFVMIKKSRSGTFILTCGECVMICFLPED